MDEPWRRGPRRLVPVVLLSGLPQTAAAVVLAVRSPSPWSGVVYGLLGLAAVAVVLLLGRRSPGVAVAGAGALELAAAAILPLPPFALLPVAVAVVRAMSAGARWWAVGTVTAFVLLPLVELFIATDARAAGRALGSTFLLVLALGAGGFRQARRVRVQAWRARQQDRQRIAVEQERVRIARELHDVLAHSLSSISVTAGVGLHLAEARPAAATEALATIRDASRSALDEVRGVLGILRGDERAPLAPEPVLDALPALVDGLRASGARIAIVDELAPRPPRAVQLALYRIVQESLTNARRHAPGAAIEVDLRQEGAEAVVRIRDRFPGARPAPPVAGNGIAGMRERAVQLGGTLAVEVRDDGLEVVSRMPFAAWRGSP